MKLSTSAPTLLLAALLLLTGCRDNAPEQKTASAPTQAASQAPTQRSNVLLIVSDALRYDMLGCDGGSARTPNIDALAAHGALFRQAHAAAPWTTPAAVGMITGRHASAFLVDKTKVVKDGDSFAVPANLPTLPATLKDAGYALALNSHNPNSWMAGNFHGFERVEVETPGSALKDEDPELVALLPTIMPFDRQSLRHRRLFGLLEFLNGRQAGSQFFAVNWINDPHAPYDPKGKFLASVPVPGEGLTRNLDFYYSQKDMHIFDHSKAAVLTAQEVEYFRGLYRAEVESVDERIGLILDMLEHKGLRDDTIVILTADHGEEFKEHDGFGHGRSYYEELVHVPLIISGPGVPAGRVVEQPVSMVDLMATVAGLLGVADGQAGFLPALRGQDWSPGPLYFDSATVFDTNNCYDGVLSGGFKLITHLSGDHAELYDLAADPGEQDNLAVSRTDKVTELTHLVEGFRGGVDETRAALELMARVPADSVSARDRAEIRKKLKSLGYVN